MKNRPTAGILAYAPKTLIGLAGLAFANISLAQLSLPATIQAES